jgi:hypothetical protein
MTLSYNNQGSKLGRPLNRVIHVPSNCDSNKNTKINNTVHYTENTEQRTLVDESRMIRTQMGNTIDQ